MSTLDHDLAAVRNAISKKQPFITGTHPLTDNSGLFFFRTGGGTGAHCIDLANADDASLQVLLEACQPAPFGIDNKDVLDETYRKAWKMDNSNFATRLDVVNTGILDCIRSMLMQGNKNKKIRPEMYKLNVYGPGSFFKAHKDTPRGENMFGSLVVVFPTRHEGGALQLRHKGQEWTFDSAAITSTQDVPSIAYVAFYGDVEHEVSMVTSGYRVTLTYNLYFDDTSSKPGPIYSWMKEDELALRTSLSALLDHRDLLPDGGYLGFGLEFMYPVARGTIRGLINSLKGSDAMIKLVLEQLNLKPQVKIIYEDNEDAYPAGHHYGDDQPPLKRPHIMLDDEDELPDWETEEPFRISIPEGGHGIVICGADEVGEYSDYGHEVLRAKKVLWVTPQMTFTSLKSPYVAYGNEASLGFTTLVGYVWMISDNGAPECRIGS
ncbi:uncharacterized protein LACBIDRAFT_325147 [Laccaria bicolor S238N-H82]|uniref:Predicted protein n=1 Tax=Laccaria bicolor (strain S238N-H82 / ATCC MYA-4686) TaxID=486041 RepID=B0D5B3_LACBS|nr:uncharacterized protein LACBIDRAFT_325147 [Laccaria bicolor S238N-H82]EDR10243.1 predicted protein [Laccaria bicolor S238N-H82]|eukprot:XP_001878693.1 predicted protein [Laccaria bicolor S238N-H82]